MTAISGAGSTCRLWFVAREYGCMNYWIKTCCRLILPAVMTLTFQAGTIVGRVIFFGATTFAQSDFEHHGVSANELARKVITNELKLQNEDRRGHWMYRLDK